MLDVGPRLHVVDLPLQLCSLRLRPVQLATQQPEPLGGWQDKVVLVELQRDIGGVIGRRDGEGEGNGVDVWIFVVDGIVVIIVVVGVRPFILDVGSRGEGRRVADDLFRLVAVVDDELDTLQTSAGAGAATTTTTTTATNETGRVVLGDGVARSQGFCLVDGAHVLGKGVAAGEAAVALGQGAVEGLLAGVAAHVGAQGVAAGMGHALAAAPLPLAAVLLLALADVHSVDVGDERVHVALLRLCAVGPEAPRHLGRVGSVRVVRVGLRGGVGGGERVCGAEVGEGR